VFCAGCFLFLGCDHKLEKRFFFDSPPQTRIERLRQYSLEDQYRIFRYGNDKIEPPDTSLAGTIAQRGASAVPFLLRQLNSQSDDIADRDALEVFGAMAVSKSYDVKADSAVMTLLSSRISEMKDKEWQSYCQRKLQRIKDTDQPKPSEPRVRDMGRKRPS
jgi:hypothetical protein